MIDIVGLFTPDFEAISSFLGAKSGLLLVIHAKSETTMHPGQVRELGDNPFVNQQFVLRVIYLRHHTNANELILSEIIRQF